MSSDDASAVRELVLAGLADHWGDVDASLNKDLDDLATAYPGGRTVVMCVDGRLVGTGTIVPRSAGGAEIVRMSVDGRQRGRGLGRALVDELAATARAWGRTHVVLETTSAWTGVVEFYRRCGFTVTHTADSPFGEDTWFRLDLD